MNHKHHQRLVFKRVRHVQIINQMVAQNRQQTEQIQADQAAMRAPSPETTHDGEPVWSAKTQMLKNRVTGGRRAARQRWVQFQGSSGGMGR